MNKHGRIRDRTIIIKMKQCQFSNLGKSFVANSFFTQLVFGSVGTKKMNTQSKSAIPIFFKNGGYLPNYLQKLSGALEDDGQPTHTNSS